MFNSTQILMHLSARFLTGLFCLVGSLSHAADPLPEGLGSWSPVVRAIAVPKAAKAGTAALPELLRDLRSDQPGLRRSATDTIALIAKSAPNRDPGDWKDVSEGLIRLLDNDPNFWVRCGAALALKAIHPVEAAPHLINAAQNSDSWVAAAAIDAISGFPVTAFAPDEYLTTAASALRAPRSETRSGAIRMIELLGPAGKNVLPQVEMSVSTLSQDSMFADRPRTEAIIWIARFDQAKAATLAGGMLKEERWGAAGRFRRLLPFLNSLGRNAAPAADGLRAVASQTHEPAAAASARKILANLAPAP